MARTIQLTVTSASSEELVKVLGAIDGVLGVRLQRGISVIPPGDVVQIDVLSRSVQEVVALLDERSILRDPTASMASSDPLSLVSTQHAVAIANDTSEATWEEMDRIMAKESNPTLNALAVMAIAGSLATIGITQNALHLVVGAMLIAPGFEPVVRGILRIVARGERPLLGWRQLAEAYAALLAGAAVTALVLTALGHDPTGRSTASYLPNGALIEYWTTISPISLLVAMIAGVAGTILIASNRSVLTAGVMVALALVPSATIFAIGLTQLDVSLAAEGAARWALEVLIVAVAATVVFLFKRATVHQGRAMS